MAYLLLSNTGAGSSDAASVTTSGINTTGADLLIVAVVDNPSVPTTVSDSESNSWSMLTAQATGGPRVRLGYVAAPTTAASHTFTATGSANSLPAICVAAFSGAAAVPFDQESGTTSASATSVQPGSITPGEANSLFVTVVSTNADRTYAINSSFAISNQVALAAAQHWPVGLAYLVGTSAQNPTWSWTGAAATPVAMATFDPAAATGGPPGLSWYHTARWRRRRQR